MSMYGERTKLAKPGRFQVNYGPRLEVALTFPEVSEWTDQSFAAECDINTIMAKYQSTGELPVLNQAEAQWLDVTGMDFQEHMNFILEAEDMFAQLPSSIRDRFGNDPAAFLDFTSDPENKTELARMGLLTPEATEAVLYPVKTETTAPVASGDASGAAGS